MKGLCFVGLRSLALFVVFCAVAISGCGGSEGAAASPADAGEPRVAVLSPGLAAVIRSLGRGDTVVGRHGFDSWTDWSVPVVGDQLGVDYEALVASAAGVVVVERGATELPARLRRVASARGMELVEVPMLTLDDVRASIGEMERVTRGSGEDAGVADEVRARFDGAFAADDGVAGAYGGTVVVAAWGPYAVTGPGSFHHDVLVRMGIEALPRDGGAWQQVTAEDIAAWGPQTVVVLAPGAGEGFDAAAAMPALASLLPGVFGAGRVVVVRRDDALLPGPGLIGVAEDVRGAAGGLR